MTSPLVSVIVPCYNLGAYLDEAVASVLSQSFGEVEVIVVDDGSTDDATKAVLGKFERARTRLLLEPHRGLARARNAGIGSASGKYLCALDADDKLHPSYLEKAVARLEADPSLAFVSAWVRNFGEEAGDWIQERCDLPALLAECTVATPALVRRDALLEAGSYDSGMPDQGYEAWNLWITLVERGQRGVIIPEVLIYNRRRKGSLSERCAASKVHLDLMRYLVTKHEASYRAHLFTVLAAREDQISCVRRENEAIENAITSDLMPTLVRRRSEIALLEARAAKSKATDEERARLETRVRQLEADLQTARQEAEAQRELAAKRPTGVLGRMFGKGKGESKS